MRKLEINDSQSVLLQNVLLTFVLSCEQQMKQLTVPELISAISKDRREALGLLTYLQLVHTEVEPKLPMINVSRSVQQLLPDFFKCSCGRPYHGTVCAAQPGQYKENGT